MFSRILANPRQAVPSDPRGLRPRRQQQHPPEHQDLALRLDHLLDVVPVAVAEVGEHLVVNCVEFFRELFEFLFAQSRERTFHMSGHSDSFRSKFEFNVAFGGVDADPYVLAGGFGDLAGAQIA